MTVYKYLKGVNTEESFSLVQVVQLGMMAYLKEKESFFVKKDFKC